MTYALKGWTISEARWPEPWTATHDDFDASYEGPEDGWVGNGLTCFARTHDGLLVEIAEIEATHPHFTGDPK